MSSLPLRLLLLLRLEKLRLKTASWRLLLCLSLLTESSTISEVILLAKILLLWLLRGIKLRLKGLLWLSPLLTLSLPLTHLRHEVHLLILLLCCWKLIVVVLRWLEGGRWRILTVLVEIRQRFKGGIFGRLRLRIWILIIHRHQIRKLLRLILLCWLLMLGNSIGSGGLTLEFLEAVRRLSGYKLRKLVVSRCCFLGDRISKTNQIFFRQSWLILLDHWFWLWFLKLSWFSWARRFASRCFLFVGRVGRVSLDSLPRQLSFHKFFKTRFFVFKQIERVVLHILIDPLFVNVLIS